MTELQKKALRKAQSEMAKFTNVRSQQFISGKLKELNIPEATITAITRDLWDVTYEEQEPLREAKDWLDAALKEN